MRWTLMMVALAASVATAEPMYLRNGQTRLIYGPIAPGAKLELPAGRYESVTPSAHEIQTVSNLHAVVIPLVHFSNAPIAQVAADITTLAHQAGAMSVTVSLNLAGYCLRKDIPAFCDLGAELRTNVPPVSLVCRYVSLFGILAEVSERTDLPVNLIDGRVVLSQKFHEAKRMVADTSDGSVRAADK